MPLWCPSVCPSFGLQSWNLASHVGGTGRLNGSEITQIDSDGGRLSIVTMSLAVTAWPQIAMQIFGTPFPFWEKGRAQRVDDGTVR